ncbi:MAG: hypothetical protein HY553_07955 [Elusimicrobia bacterium]|nr:hypothetical protein [Elusimicrobiota bacterium]
MAKVPDAGASLPALGWRLARSIVFTPTRAAETLRSSPDAVPAALVIYFAYLAVSVAFYSWKPVDFPVVTEDRLGLQLSNMPTGPVFWAKVQAWNPFLTAILAFFLAWFAQALKGGRLAARVFKSALVWILPMLAILLWSGKAVPNWAVVAVWAVVLVPMIRGTRARPPETWRPLIAFVLSIVTVNLTLCPLFVVAVATRNQGLYTVLELGMLAWMLGLGCFLIGRLEELPAARAFVGLFFAMLAQITVAISLFIAGIVSKDILKALMSV